VTAYKRWARRWNNPNPRNPSGRSYLEIRQVRFQHLMRPVGAAPKVTSDGKPLWVDGKRVATADEESQASVRSILSV
jgi:hypothetical protein